MDEKVEFTRDIPRTDPREIWADGGKWKDLFLLIQKAQAEGATTLVVASPEMLGDTWRELVLNLTAIASAGLLLEIQPPTGHAVTRCEVDFSSGQEKELLVRDVFEKKVPLVANAGASPATKNGPYILKVGNQPAVVLGSSGPDETYCQAELLLKRDWEEFKPSSKKRQIEGFYEITGGTVEWFLHQHADKASQGVIEDYRRKILEQGWGAFYLSGQACDPHPISTEDARHLSYRMNLVNHDVSKKDLKIAKGLMKKFKSEIKKD